MENFLQFFGEEGQIKRGNWLECASKFNKYNSVQFFRDIQKIC